MLTVELLNKNPQLTDLYFKKRKDMVLYKKESTPPEVQDELLQQPVFNSHSTAVAILNILSNAAGKVTDFEILMCNMFLANATGLSSQDMIGKRISAVVQDVMPGELMENLINVAETGQSSCFELGYTIGEQNYCFRYVANKVNNLLVVTSEDSAEPEITESKLFAEQVMEATPDFIMIYNLLDDRMEFVNRKPYNNDEDRYRETMRIGREALLARAHPDDREPLKQFIDKFRTADDNEVYTIDYRVLKDEQITWYRSRGKVFKRNAFGIVTHYISVIQDISEVKRLEEENLAIRLNQQKSVLLAILEAQEEERRRVSEALHNGVGQLLYAAKLNLERFHDQPQAKAQRESLKNIQDLLSEAINETRRVSHELVPALLKEFGLEKAIKYLCEQFEHSALYLSCNVTGIHKPLDTHLEVAVYRMSQELINNVVKHAQATAATLNLTLQQNTLLLQIRDNGIGFNTDKLKSTGIGLRTIGDRVKLLNGTLTITTPKSGKGTFITISIPL